MDFAFRLRQRRAEMGYTLQIVADKTGFSRQTIHKYETGVITNIPSDKIERLASALHTTPAYLMGWEEVQQKNSTLVDITIRMQKDSKFCSIVEKLNKLPLEKLDSIAPLVDVLLKD